MLRYDDIQRGVQHTTNRMAELRANGVRLAVADAISKIFFAIPIENQSYVSRINPRGVHVIEC